MKKVLITGANSYVGNAVEAWLKKATNEVTVLDMQTDEWRNFDFSPFDTVFHVAGIAHLKEKRKNKALYFKINAALPVEVAQKAKDSGVKQFIFMSSMSIYAGYGNCNIIAATPYKPKGYYGHSKLQADLSLQELNSDTFKIAILRPPMIFGKDCKGNFPRLVKLACKLPLFPKIKNQRSMLHIDNLCELIKLLIENESQGIFFPQNKEYYCTTDIIVKIAEMKDKKLKATNFINLAVWLLYPFMSQIKKMFGNLTYDKALSSDFNSEYQIVDNECSVLNSI